MKISRLFALIVLVSVATSAAFATNMADVVKAQVILGKILEYTSKYQLANAVVTAPTPIASNAGKYVLPYGADGQMTAWATKTLNAKLGSLAGEKAGEQAGKALASKVPFGGFASGLMKSKGKEMGAMAAIGGADFIKKSSSVSFNNLEDYAVYLHVKYSTNGDYTQALAAAMAIYPSLETGYDNAVKSAYQRAAKATR